MDNEVLPWLRKQKGFLDTITLAVPGGKEIVSISFWDQEKSAEVYNSTSYPQALEILKKILAGTPQVRTFDVVSSTLQKVGPSNSALSTVRARRQQWRQHDSRESKPSGVSCGGAASAASVLDTRGTVGVGGSPLLQALDQRGRDAGVAELFC
jgi:heme-degrading monooxygenase HmoA